jgi:hypothetical protein
VGKYVIQFHNHRITAIRAAEVADFNDNFRMMGRRAKYRSNSHEPVENGLKRLLIILGEGIKVADLKEKNEKLPFLPAEAPLFNASPI